MKKYLSTGLLGFLFATSILQAAAEETNDIRSKAERDALTPKQVLHSLKEGNERFVNGNRRLRDFRQEQLATVEGQHPASVLVSCIDSRAPAEILFDKGIGEMFNARLAGNVVNSDIVGSLEFACAAAGAKLVVVMGHTGCGALHGAINQVEFGNLTGLLERVHPAIEESKKANPGPYTLSNKEFVEAVTKNNVLLAVEKIRRLSPLLRKMEEDGKIQIVGGIYNLETGKVDFLEP